MRDYGDRSQAPNTTTPCCCLFGDGRSVTESSRSATGKGQPLLPLFFPRYWYFSTFASPHKCIILNFASPGIRARAPPKSHSYRPLGCAAGARPLPCVKSSATCLGCLLSTEETLSELARDMFASNARTMTGSLRIESRATEGKFPTVSAAPPQSRHQHHS